MRVVILMAIALGCHTANAEVFKCIGKAGKTVYQEKPCQSAVKEQRLDIKADPIKEAEAKARLEALEKEHEARRAERLQEEEDAAAERYQADQVNALKRSAIAQQQQAAAQRRQADALEQQNQQIISPWWLFPRHPDFRRSPGERVDRDLNRDRDFTRREPQERRPAPMSPSSSRKDRQ